MEANKILLKDKLFDSLGEEERKEMCEICICENPLTDEEKAEYWRILTKYKDDELKDYIWSKLTAKEHIRFMHFLVITCYRIEELKKLI